MGARGHLLHHIAGRSRAWHRRHVAGFLQFPHIKTTTHGVVTAWRIKYPALFYQQQPDERIDRRPLKVPHGSTDGSDRLLVGLPRS